MKPAVHLLSETPDLLGESPVWDHRSGRLFWVDGVGRLVHGLDPASGERWQCPTPSMVGSIALAEQGRLVCGLADGIWMLDLASGAFEPVFRPDPVNPAIRFNDGKTDRQGRFLCGSMGVHAEPVGTLWRVGERGAARALVGGIRISNALCFSPDGRVMYFADSLERRIRAYDYGAGEEGLGEARVFADTAGWDSGPDGATVDAEGCVWTCLVRAGRIARFTPQGALDRLIDAPTDLPSSLAFGGPGLDTLFVTSIRDSGSGRAVSKHPRGGCLHALTGLGVRGIAETPFRLTPEAAGA